MINKIFKIYTNNQFKNRLKYGYLWIFSNEIIRENLPKENVFVEAYDNKNNFLCKGVYNPHSLISIRVLTTQKNIDINKNFFKQKIIDALKFRKDYGIDTNFCRIVYGESDFLPGVVIDRYRNTFVIQFFSSAMEIFKKEILESIIDIFEPENIIVRNDVNSRIYEQAEQNKEVLYSKKEINPVIEIEHIGAKFLVDVLNGQKTGFYYDQLENRKYLFNIVRDKKVLDLCCYTGSFSIISKIAEAKEVVGIDSSVYAIELAQQNAKLNKVKVNFINEEVEEFLLHNKEKFDIIIFDPPSYTKSKKDIKKAKQKYEIVCRNILKFLERNGVFIFSVCAQHISWQDVGDIVNSSILKNNQKGVILYYGKQSIDHPVYLPMKQETEYLKFIATMIR